MEPSTAAACASCRRHPLPPSLLLCLLLVALCLPPGERPPAEKGDRAVPAARNLAEGRLGPQVAVSARGSLLPAGFPFLTRPSFTGAPRHLLRSPCAWPCVTPGCWCSPHPILPRREAGGDSPHLSPPPAPGKAAEDGRRGELMPPLPRERQELFQRCGELRGGGLASPRGKRPWGPSGALSPAAGQRAGRGDGARRPFHFQAGRHVSAASRLQLRQYSLFPFPLLQCRPWRCPAACRFRATGELAPSGSRWVPGHAVGVVPSSSRPGAGRKRGGAALLSVSPARATGGAARGKRVVSALRGTRLLRRIGLRE